MTVSVVIPLFRPDVWRLQALAFVLGKLAPAPVVEVLVVHQVRPHEVPWTSFPAGPFRTIPVKSDLDESHKARLVNVGLQESRGAFVWILDADIWAPYGQVLQDLPADAQAVMPHRAIWRLSQEQTEAFYRGGRISTRGCHAVRKFGGGSLIVRRDLAMELGGMDERFRGWAPEDVEFAARIEAAAPVVRMRHIALHLYHPRDVRALKRHARPYHWILAETRKRLSACPRM